MVTTEWRCAGPSLALLAHLAFPKSGHLLLSNVTCHCHNCIILLVDIIVVTTLTSSPPALLERKYCHHALLVTKGLKCQCHLPIGLFLGPVKLIKKPDTNAPTMDLRRTRCLEPRFGILNE
jgi:hypothetical protein